MSSVTSPSMRASSPEVCSIHTKPRTLGKREVKRVVGLKPGLGSILNLESVRSPRGSVATKVNRNPLGGGLMGWLGSFFCRHRPAGWEGHTSDFKSRSDFECGLLLEKKKIQVS